MSIRAKYRFFGERSNCNNHDIIITAYSELNDENVLTVGYSFCSKHDKYDKHKGKVIAKNRHDKNPCLIIKFENPPKFSDIDLVILENSFKSKYKPASLVNFHNI